MEWIYLLVQAVNWLLLWRWVRQDRPETASETPEEAARRRFEQGFVNLMQYDGSPRRKERDGL